MYVFLTQPGWTQRRELQPGLDPLLGRVGSMSPAQPLATSPSPMWVTNGSTLTGFAAGRSDHRQ